MPLLKIFMSQVFGALIYNLTIDQVLKANLVKDDDVARIVLGVVLSVLCFAIQLYTEKTDVQSGPTKEQPRRRPSDKVGSAAEFLDARRAHIERTIHEAMGHIDARQAPMYGETHGTPVFNTTVSEPEKTFVKPPSSFVVEDAYVAKYDDSKVEINVDANRTPSSEEETEEDEEVEEKENKSEEEKEVCEEEEQEEEEVEAQVKENKSEKEKDVCEDEEEKEKSEPEQDAVEDDEEEDIVTVIDVSKPSDEKKNVTVSNREATESEEEDESEVSESKKKEKASETKKIKQEESEEEESEEEEEETVKRDVRKRTEK